MTLVQQVQVSVSVSAQDGTEALGQAHTCSALSATSPRLPLKQCHCFVGSFPSSEGEMSAASFSPLLFHSSNQCYDVCPVHVQKGPEPSKHLCPARLQTRYDICCACQSKLPTRCSICCACSLRSRPDVIYLLCLQSKLQTRCNISAVLAVQAADHM